MALQKVINVRSKLARKIFAESDVHFLEHVIIWLYQAHPKQVSISVYEELEDVIDNVLEAGLLHNLDWSVIVEVF